MITTLTLFTIPKAFTGETGQRQLASLRSWRRACPDAEIFVMGGEAGSREAGAEVGAVIVPDIGRNAAGTPLLSDAFAEADARAANDFLCYINADILFFNDFARAVAAVLGQIDVPFLMTGRRRNFEMPADGRSHDTEELHRLVAGYGELYDEFNMDYFVFPRGLFRKFPPFAVGRPGWDNWLVYEARRLGLAVIDATAAITAGHPNHDYAHTTEGLAGGKAGLWAGAEASANRELAGGRLFDLSDATHVLTDTLVVHRRRDPGGWWRRRAVAHEIYPRWARLLRPLAALDEWLCRADHAVRLWFLHHGVDLFPHKEKRSKAITS